MTEFILNNKTIRTDKPRGMTLLDFIRYEKHLTGTKIGCREGDCGACTILIGRIKNGALYYESMTSCITPLGNARNKHVVTVEGLNMDELNPAQQAIVDAGGTQCGFCTVGFVVSLTGYCLTTDSPSVEGAISAIDGNICRCTGYKSLERAADALAAKLKDKNLQNPVDWLVKNRFLPEYFSGIQERLSKIEPPKPRVEAPVYVAGGTDLYVQKHDDMHDEDIQLLFDRDEYNGIIKENGKIVLGSAVSATDLMNSDIMKEIFPNLYKHMKLVSSTPIRNMGTIAGNFVNASPIGDLTAFFIALDSDLVLHDMDGNERRIRLRDFYLGYKVLNKKANEAIYRIEFKIPHKETKFNFEKVCKRTYLDIATVNTAIRIRVDAGIIREIHLSAGGVGPTPAYLEKTCAFMTGKNLNPSLLLEANEVIQNEISPISDVRGSADYKRLLLRQLFYAHFLELYPELTDAGALV